MISEQPNANKFEGKFVTSDQNPQATFTIMDTSVQEIVTVSDKQMTVNGAALLKAMNNNTLSNEDWLVSWATVAGYYNKTADRHAALCAAVLAGHWNEAARLARGTGE